MKASDKEKQIELDKSIAYFLGWRIDNSFPDKGKVWRKGASVEFESTFKFSCNWDWLMEVVNHINQMEGYSIGIFFCQCKIYKNDVLETSVSGTQGTQYVVYNCLGEFIKEYNKQQIS